MATTIGIVLLWGIIIQGSMGEPLPHTSARWFLGQLGRYSLSSASAHQDVWALAWSAAAPCYPASGLASYGGSMRGSEGLGTAYKITC